MDDNLGQKVGSTEDFDGKIETLFNDLFAFPISYVLSGITEHLEKQRCGKLIRPLCQNGLSVGDLIFVNVGPRSLNHHTKNSRI